MGKKKSAMAGRAWRLLRLAVLWARKGGAFKQKLMLDLRLRPRFLNRRSDDRRLQYGDREFSFDDTPVFHFKMHRPASMRHLRLPCIDPPTVNFDDDDDNGYVFYKRDREIEARDDYDIDDDSDDELNCEIDENDDGGIDSKAEEFIAQFYKQMKMQRQVSYLQYNEMLDRGTS